MIQTKKIFWPAFVFWLITLVISKMLLKKAIVTSDIRLDLSIHIFTGLFVYIWIYYGIKNLFDPKLPNFKRNTAITFWVCISTLFLIDFFFFENFLRIFLIQFATIFTFGFIFLFMNRKILFS